MGPFEGKILLIYQMYRNKLNSVEYFEKIDPIDLKITLEGYPIR